MKKYKGVILGFIAGTVVSSVGLMAYGNSMPISAFEDNRIGYVFGESERKLPNGDFTTVVYKDRTYVPVSFLTDNLGGRAIWDHETRTVIIDVPEKVVEVGKIVEVEKIIEVCPEETANYRGLPQSFVNNDIRLDVTLFSRNKGELSSDFYISFENKGGDIWQVDLYQTEFISNGKTYSLRGVPTNRIDTRFFNDIRSKETLDGYVTVSNIPEDVNNGILKIVARSNVPGVQPVEMTFPIKLN